MLEHTGDLDCEMNDWIHYYKRDNLVTASAKKWVNVGKETPFQCKTDILGGEVRRTIK